MKVIYQVTPKLSIEVEAENTFDAFNGLAKAQQVFDISQCGCCGSDELKFVVREASDEKGKKTFVYPEYWCSKCYARLSFGRTDDGQIYPKTKLSQLAVDKSDSDKKRYEENKDFAEKNHNWLKDKGWYKYQKDN